MAEKMAFVGGCATGLLLTDPAASPVRATLDVDVIVAVATLTRYHWLSDQLRQLGFIEDTSEDAPICRWKRDFLDALPGHLLPDAASQARSIMVIDRLKAIAGS